MDQEAKSQVWVAVRVERGFPVEVQGFWERDSAIRKEKSWRNKINLDYDETEVLPLAIPTQ
jgi:hypothetical protein